MRSLKTVEIDLQLFRLTLGSFSSQNTKHSNISKLLILTKCVLNVCVRVMYQIFDQKCKEFALKPLYDFIGWRSVSLSSILKPIAHCLCK